MGAYSVFKADENIPTIRNSISGKRYAFSNPIEKLNFSNGIQENIYKILVKYAIDCVPPKLKASQFSKVIENTNENKQYLLMFSNNLIIECHLINPPTSNPQGIKL